MAQTHAVAANYLLCRTKKSRFSLKRGTALIIQLNQTPQLDDIVLICAEGAHRLARFKGADSVELSTGRRLTHGYDIIGVAGCLAEQHSCDCAHSSAPSKPLAH